MLADFPTFEAFCARFDSELACINALFEARWPDGFRCPRCRHPRFYLTATRRLPLYECVSCRHQTSLTAGTVMEGSPTSLVRWFRAFYLLSRPEGISAKRLSAVIEVTYKTAWLIAHKIRHAMALAEEKEPLKGIVRIETLFYGDYRYLDAQQPLILAGSFDENEKLTEVSIVQPHPDHVEKKTRRIVPDGIAAFEDKHVEKSARRTYRDRNAKAREALIPFHVKLPNWLNDTFHGIGAKHLQAYVHEFAHRWNLSSRGAPALVSVLGLCASTRRIVYKTLTRDRPMLEVPWRAFGSRSKWKGSHMRYWG